MDINKLKKTQWLKLGHSKRGAFYLIDYNQYAKYESFYKEKNTQFFLDKKKQTKH